VSSSAGLLVVTGAKALYRSTEARRIVVDVSPSLGEECPAFDMTVGVEVLRDERTGTL